MYVTSVNTTALPPDDQHQVSAVWGYLALVMSGICFGTASVPIKRCEPGDGVLFQLVSDLALWSVGLIINCIRDYPKFYFLPMIGGACFATSNMKMVPILKTIGIGLGTSIRASIGIIVGWADARYGIFGTVPQRPANPIENYIGIVIILIGAILFLIVRSSGSTTEPEEETATVDETRSLMQDGLTRSRTTSQASIDPAVIEPEVVIANGHIRTSYGAIDANTDHDNGKYFLQSFSPIQKRVLGVSLSITAGICVGFTYAPYLYVIDRYDNVSKNGLDYVFSMFTGTLFSAFVFFIIYCCAKNNRPYINAKSILPGALSGWIWGVGVCCFQFANSILSQAVTFPIGCGLQSLVGVLYGLFLFKEITGRRNLVILAVGFVATVGGSALVGISKY